MNTTVREANDRGYDCLVLEDCVGSYLPDMHEAGLKMIKEQGGIFGWVAHSDKSSGRARVAFLRLPLVGPPCGRSVDCSCERA